jgi:hypothetical protein
MPKRLFPTIYPFGRGGALRAVAVRSTAAAVFGVAPRPSGQSAANNHRGRAPQRALSHFPYACP